MWLWMLADEQGAGGADPSRRAHPTPQPKASEPSPAKPPPPIDDQGELDDEDTVGREIGRTLNLLMPWAVSILLHLALILIAVFMVWSLGVIADEEEDIIPIARLSAQVGGSLTQSEKMDLARTQQVRKVMTQEVADEDALSHLNSKTKTELQLIGAAGGGGKMAPFGTVQGQGGIKANFFGLGGNAKKLVYVVDASGSLLNSFPAVVGELKRSISQLSDKQRFTVIFFQRDTAIEVPPRQLKVADAQTIKRVGDWLAKGNIITQGTSNPVKAMRLAFNYRPDLIFVLSDNITGAKEYEIDQRDLLNQLDQLNKARKTKINTIQFLYPDQFGTLKMISDQHGGLHTFVSAEDVGLE